MAEHEAHLARLHLDAQMAAHVVVEAAQNLIAAVNHDDVGAQTGKQRGEFERDVAAALDDDPARQFLQIERLVRGDGESGAGNLRPHRVAASSDQDESGADTRAGVQEAHRMRILHHRAAVDDLAAGALHGAAVGLLEPGDFLVFVFDKGRPIEVHVADRPAKSGGVLELVAEAAGVDEQLLRDAAADHAGAADAGFLGDHDAGAVLAGNARRAHAARARPDDEKIDVVFGHAISCG